MVSYPDFKRAFQSSDEDMESRAMIAEGHSNFEQVPPRPVPELVDVVKVIFLSNLIAVL